MTGKRTPHPSLPGPSPTSLTVSRPRHRHPLSRVVPADSPTVVLVPEGTPKGRPQDRRTGGAHTRVFELGPTDRSREPVEGRGTGTERTGRRGPSRVGRPAS